ncbi:MAG: hypothetical protein EZS28_055404, partial [Streblomastix strix]
MIEVSSNTQFYITGNTLFERINFTMVGITQLRGGAIFSNLAQSYNLLEISSCIFTGFKTSKVGGALFFQFNNPAQHVLRNLTFSLCEAGDGGAIYAELYEGGKLTLSGSCSFTDCKATSVSGQGGGINASIQDMNSQLVLEDSITFKRCSGRRGGGLSLFIYNNGSFTMTGSCLFTYCNSNVYGGG